MAGFDSNSYIDIPNYKTICRIHLHRSLNVDLRCGSTIQIIVMLASEQCLPIPYLLLQCELLFEFCQFENDLVCTSTKLISSVIEDDYLKVKLLAPLISGCYSLKINSKKCPDNCYILPLQVGPINIADSISSHSSPILTAGREFRTTTDKIIFIQEEYGATLGSHLWDSSIVLFHYLERTVNFQEVQSTMVELGAGCGLLGILYALHNPSIRVYLTDKSYQMPYLTKNIQINKFLSHDCIKTKSLDWFDINQLNEFKTEINNTIIDVIIAADVLYDHILAESLIHVLRELATPKRTKIYIAQKIRRESDSQTRDNTSTSNTSIHTSSPAINSACHSSRSFPIETVEGFHIEKVFEQARVIIWLLILQQ
eukprot:gene10138-21142_t